MTPEDARDHLLAIRQVVERARTERAANGDIYVLWGVVLVAGVVCTLGADALGWPYGWASFPILGVPAGAWTAYSTRARGLSRDTYGVRIEGTLWGSTTVGCAALIFGGLATDTLPLQAVIPTISAVIGVALTTSGAIFGHRALTYSGWAFLALVLPCMFLDWRTQYAVFAVAMTLGYIVPGVVLWREGKSAV